MRKTKQAVCHPSHVSGAIRITALVWLAFAGWLVTLFILSSIPGDQFAPSPFSWADKAVHTLIFTAGSFLLATGFYRLFGNSILKTTLLTFITMVLIGIGDEFHQVYTPGRSGNDRGDLIADTLGVLIGIACARLLHGKRSQASNLPTANADRAA